MFPILIDASWLTIYSYPLFMGLSWGLAYNLGLGYLESRGLDVKGYRVLFWGTFITSWIGAKVFFLIYSSGDEFVRYSGASEFWFGGGFVFYGGLIFGTLFILLWTTLLKKFPLSQTYLFLPALCFGHAVGRVGCLLAGCCFGTASQIPWSVHLHGAERHPVQIYESLLVFCLGLFLHRLITKNTRPLTVTLTYFSGYSLFRFLFEFFRGDIVRGVHAFGLSTSQFISIALFIVMAAVLMYLKVSTKKEIQ